MSGIIFMGVGIVLDKLKDWFKNEFADFGRPVSEQKLMEKQAEPPVEVQEVKAEAASQSKAEPPSPASQATTIAQRVTPKMTTIGVQRLQENRKANAL